MKQMTVISLGILSAIFIGAFFLRPTYSEVRMDSIYHRIGGPLTVSVYNPPNSFWKAVDKLNSKELVLKKWSPLDSPWEADVWVFFVPEPSHLYI